MLGRPDEASPLRAVIEVRSPLFYRQLLRGSVGLCESYLDGQWECSDLVAMTRIAARNAATLDRAAARWPRRCWSRRSAARAGCSATRRGARARQIEAHYDLGNELFELFLDETMMYSCAVFETPQATPARGLAREARADLRAACELGPEDHVLEIGTGWGGFAVHAAGALRLPRDDDDDLPRTARLRERARAPRRG